MSRPRIIPRRGEVRDGMTAGKDFTHRDVLTRLAPYQFLPSSISRARSGSA
ncbi:hypothetical protein [Bradyrhizobium sp. Ai1a-2]|uniref:hypothetical protein n=1 Tax=Bradyrhizobium sp. Ai1a-2 TaxID=196490 RepID=UPI0003F568FA|nr:hypothetical protein [Bradyrhizobium sp. Ai1a-2]